MHWYTYLLLIVFVFVCVFLIGVILLQAGKGGGLSGLAGGSSGAFADALGATSAEKTLSMWTTVAAISFATMCILLTFISSVTGRQTAASALSDDAPPPAAETPAPDEQPPFTLPETGATSKTVNVEQPLNLQMQTPVAGASGAVGATGISAPSGPTGAPGSIPPSQAELLTIPAPSADSPVPAGPPATPNP